MPESSESVRSSASETNEAVAGVTSTNLPSGSNEPGKPFHDLAQWATKAPEGETLISTAYGDKVTEDLKFVENTPGVHKPDPILVANNVTRKFGGMTAVDVKHFEIERHGITALIGPNGAGKTTFFNLMTGFDTPNTGEWQFDGRDMAHVQPEKVARMGMVRTFQADQGDEPTDRARQHAARCPRAARRRHVPLAGARPVEKAGEGEPREGRGPARTIPAYQEEGRFRRRLSGGQRKLLEMARALMSDPQLVMLDEPMAGVNPALKQSLLDHIMSLREEGTTVLFVEHDINMVRHIADWVTVMAEGKIVAEGQPKAVMNDPAVIDAYLAQRQHRPW